MAHSPYIQTSRHNIFYFRIRVPLSLKAIFQCPYIRRSLHTKCRREALIRSAVLLDKTLCLFKRASNGQDAKVSELTWVPDKEPKVTQGMPVREKRPKKPIAPTLSKVFDEYLKAQRLDGVGEKTLNDKQSVMNLLIRIIGDLPVSDYQRSHANKFKDIALQLPTQVNRRGKVSIQQLIDNAKFTISTTTFNNYIKNIITVFVYAIREGLCLTNPFEGLKLKQRIKLNAQRSRFTEGDLKHLFAIDIYTGRKTCKDYQYWLPLLGAYTGARMNEICQLYLGDIKSVNGIDCIHVQATHDDQKLKTPGGCVAKFQI